MGTNKSIKQVQGSIGQKVKGFSSSFLQEYESIENYEEENGLKKGVLNKIFLELQKKGVIIGSKDWMKLTDKYYNKYGVSMSYMFEWTDHPVRQVTYTDGSKETIFV
jgi:hypothetical protein